MFHHFYTRFQLVQAFVLAQIVLFNVCDHGVHTFDLEVELELLFVNVTYFVQRVLAACKHFKLRGGGVGGRFWAYTKFAGWLEEDHSSVVARHFSILLTQFNEALLVFEETSGHNVWLVLQMPLFEMTWEEGPTH